MAGKHTLDRCREQLRYMMLLPLLERAGGCSADVYTSFSCAMHTQALLEGSHWINQLGDLRRGQTHVGGP